MEPADASVIAHFITTTIEREIPTTAAVFDAVPATELSYRPHPRSKTALQLIRHITLEDEWMLNAVADGRFAPLPDDSDACGLMTPADAVARYTTRMPAAIARVRALPGSALLRELDLLGMVQMPAIGFVSLMVRHSAHHRGQLSTYLRPMGAPVPSIYGPTAETDAERALR
jgi:uncharacterized damage-inducible protein DinB